MNLTIPVSFSCEPSIRPYLQKIFDGEYEVPLHSRKSYTIVDCGANCGAFSVWASYRFPNSIVYAYEPHPGTYELLRENTKGLAVLTQNTGVGKAGWRKLFDGANNSGEQSLFQSEDIALKDTGRHVEIIDSLLLPPADIIKIDTEGCEIEILEPLIRDGRKFDAVMFEYHRVADRRKLDSLLSDYILTGTEVLSSSHGTCKYVHREKIGEY